MLSEIVVVPTYKRPEHLRCCLKRIRQIDPLMPILIFPDRGTWKDHELLLAIKGIDLCDVNFVPDHEYIGNSYNTMEALRAAYNEGWQVIYYVEDDVMIHDDFFTWHREVHDDVPGLFASMAWIFNRYAPLVDDVMFQPWYYAIGTCFRREKLELVIQHASPRYYADMQKYIEENFKGNRLNQPGAIAHYEQDGLIQRVLDVDRTQTASPGITKCSHIGFYGYNRGWQSSPDIFEGIENFDERVERLEEFIADPVWRASIFTREVVEREIGRKIPKRIFNYRVQVGELESTFTSELDRKRLPKRINSVNLPPEAIIEKIS